jgi:hypothetical protein
MYGYSYNDDKMKENGQRELCSTQDRDEKYVYTRIELPPEGHLKDPVVDGR